MNGSPVDRIGVYAGVFDCPTTGHLHIIEKACRIFDQVIVIIATNPQKIPMFSIEERKSMVEDMVKNEGIKKKVEVAVLPENEYLASYARRRYGKVTLVRGIRDNIDFSYEQNICRTNKIIEPSVETIHLMPDDNYSLVSSSWVKGLVGKNNWRNVIEDSVTPFVLNALKERFLWKEFDQIISNVCSSFHKKIIWEKMVQNYRPRPYHNFDHILNGLEAFRLFYPQASNTMLLAWFLHDIQPSEDETIKYVRSFFHNIVSDIHTEKIYSELASFIEATKHETCEYKTEEEAVIASIDLMCLGLPTSAYASYRRKVFYEYFDRFELSHDEFLNKWREGRFDFIEKMLNRVYIYPWETIRKNLEEQAIVNLNWERRQMR